MFINAIMSFCGTGYFRNEEHVVEVITFKFQKGMFWKKSVTDSRMYHWLEFPSSFLYHTIFSRVLLLSFRLLYFNVTLLLEIPNYGFWRSCSISQFFIIWTILMLHWEFAIRIIIYCKMEPFDEYQVRWIYKIRVKSKLIKLYYMK